MARALGRRPLARFEVVVRDAGGRPMVIRCHPLTRVAGRVEPFPTLHWLCCPALVMSISELERAGGVMRARRLLEGDSRLRMGVEADHRACAAARLAALGPGEREAVVRAGWLGALAERGIGGARHPSAIKCLHAHYAHHLAVGGALGPWIEAELTRQGASAL